MAIHKDQLYMFGGRSNDCKKYALACTRTCTCTGRATAVCFLQTDCAMFSSLSLLRVFARFLLYLILPFLPH